MDFTSENFIRRNIISIIATILIGISIGMMRVVDFGVDPFTSLIIGIGNILNTPFRNVYPVINAGILLLIFFLNREMLGTGTLINLLLIGPVADFTAIFISDNINPNGFFTRLLILAVALIIMAMNVSLYTSTKIGVSAYDSLFLTINKKNPQISLGKARIITDATSLIVGFLGKATLGIGTVTNMLFMGPMVEFFNNTTSKYILEKAKISFEK